MVMIWSCLRALGSERHVVTVDKSSAARIAKKGFDAVRTVAFDRLRSGLALGAGAPQLALVSATAGAGISELLATIDEVGADRGVRGRVRRVEAHLVAAAESHVDAQVREATASGALTTRAEQIVAGAQPLTGSITALFGISETPDA